MSEMNVNQVLAQMRTMSTEATNKPAEVDNDSDFAALLKQSIDNVNETQHVAKKWHLILKRVSLMLAWQK